MKKIFTLIALCGVGLSASAQLATWNVFGQTAYGTQNLAPATILPSLQANPGLTRGVGLTTSGTPGGNLWGGNGWAFTTSQNAIDSVKYVTFGVRNNNSTPQGQIIITGLDSLKIRVSSSGPIQYLIQGRKNGAAFQDLGTQTVTRPATTANFVLNPVVVPATIGVLAPTDSFVFRIIPYGATTATGTWYIGNQISATHVSIVGVDVLPATLRNLSALVQNNQTRISFEASNEVNVAYYGVEKSTDGRSFSEIAKLEARGGGQYSYPDPAPVTNTWYRIRTNDRDGRSQVSEVVAVKGEKAISVKVYPNPVSDVAIIGFPELKGNATLNLVDMSGRRLQTRTLAAGTTQVSLAVAELVKGNYLIQLIDGNDVSTVTLVK